MIALLSAAALAIPREDVLDRAGAYAFHQWTMTEVNETATCSDDYTSDYVAGTYRGLPYDWGGYYELDAFDAAIASGLGAGSHSWHGSLSCTAGLDCSGFLSKVWQAPHNSTSSMYTITTDIALDDMLRADAFNDAGSHCTLFAYETDRGVPVFYEAAGSAEKTRINAASSWGYLDGYQPIRYDGIEDGGTSGTIGEPIAVEAFPFEDLRWTAGAASDAIDRYACAPSTDESGPEMLYRFSTRTGGTLRVVVSDDEGVDVDVHVMTSPDGESCLARHDTEVTVAVEPGEVWIALDTFVASREFPGPYLVTATFDGELGEPDPVEPEPTDDPDDVDVASGAEGELPWPRERMAKGCATAPVGGLAGGAAAWLGAAAFGAGLRRNRRRR